MLAKAIEALENYNNYRRTGEGECPSPYEIGITIDYVIDVLKGKSKQIYLLKFEEGELSKYELVKETKCYVYLTNQFKVHILKINKKTLSVKAFREGKNGYSFNMLKAELLIKQ